MKRRQKLIWLLGLSCKKAIRFLLCTDGVWGVINDQQIKDILQKNASITDATVDLMDCAEFASDENGDNMSAIGLQWGERTAGQVAVSTQLMPLGATTTIMNPVTQQNVDGTDPLELSDDDIEKTIAAIQNALNKTQQKPKI